jgi:hypothetical protein
VDASQLFLALFFSTVGFSYLLYGKKRRLLSFIASGIGLMFFGYFVDSVWLSTLIGGLLLVVPYFWRG